MKLKYDDEILREVDDKECYDSQKIYALVKSFGVKQMQITKTDHLEIELDKDLLSEQVDELEICLNKMDLNKAKTQEVE